MASRPGVCGKLVQAGGGKVDICKLERGHGGEHEGRHYGVRWIHHPAKVDPLTGQKTPRRDEITQGVGSYGVAGAGTVHGEYGKLAPPEPEPAQP